MLIELSTCKYQVPRRGCELQPSCQPPGQRQRASALLPRGIGCSALLPLGVSNVRKHIWSHCSLTLTHAHTLSLRSFIERTHAYMVLLDCATHTLGVPAGGRAERLLDAARKAGECVWRLGLLHKGPGLCHGISGGGFSLLALHRDDPESRRGLSCSVLSFCSLTTAAVVESCKCLSTQTLAYTTIFVPPHSPFVLGEHFAWGGCTTQTPKGIACAGSTRQRVELIS